MSICKVQHSNTERWRLPPNPPPTLWGLLFPYGISVYLRKRLIMLCLSFACVLWLSILALYKLASAEPLAWNGRRQGTAPQENHTGAVASESSICSNFGIDALKDGGNAADAVRKPDPRYVPRTNKAQLVATVFCIGVIGMYHSGLGGGGFMLVRGPNGTYEFIGLLGTRECIINVAKKCFRL